MSEFVQEIRKYINANRLLKKGDKVLVACSGGADSIALLRVLSELKDELGIGLGVAHLNHGMRPEAEEDRRFVRRIARKMRLPFHSKSLDVPKYASSNGLTPEEAARECRYGFLRKISSNFGFTKIAVGHNSDDNVETVLFNIIRGCGLNGLRGIRPARNEIVRPLLCVSRKEIEEWLGADDVEFVTDDTNVETAFTRNRIRHRLLPYLRKNFSSAVDGSITRLSLISSEVDGFLAEETVKAISRLTIERDMSKIILDLKKFRKYHTALRQSIVREVIRLLTGFGYPPDYKTVDHFLTFCNSSRSGKKFFPGGVVAELFNDKIIFGTLREKNIKKRIMLPGLYSCEEMGFSISGEILKSIPRKKEYVTDRKNVTYIDFAKLDNPVIIRNIKAGDRIIPLGMSGHKSVMDILAEQGIPSFLRSSQLVITAASRVAWVVGIRSSEEFKIDSHTQKVLRLEYAE